MATSSPVFIRFRPGTIPIPRLDSLLRKLAPRYTPPLDSYVELAPYARKLAGAAEIVIAHFGPHDCGLAAFYANDTQNCRAFLSTIAVTAKRESFGLAKALLNQALSISYALGMNRMRLAVAVRNSHALEFYLRQGFQPVLFHEYPQANVNTGPILLLERSCPPPGDIATIRPPDSASITPAFREPLHVGRPNIGNRGKLLARFGDMLDRRLFTNNGPFVREFEQRIAAFLGVKHCVATCNATVALEIACRALELKGEVIMPAFTFVATPHAFQWQGVLPRFADIDPGSHNLDPGSIEALITPETSAIVGVHVWGRACDTEALELIGRRHGLTVLYDAAHAFGCSHRGRMIGGFGRCEVFSFHATKFLNSFEGGATTTNDDALAEKLRLIRNFGFTGVDQVDHLGVNGKMTEVCAAMGITSLEAFEEFVTVNRRNHEAYQAELAGLPGLTVLRYDAHEKNNFQYVVVEVDPEVCPLDRDSLVALLQQESVLARRYFWPGCHRLDPYRSRPGGIPSLPATEQVSSRVMVLPTGQAVSPAIVAHIGHILRRALV